MRRLNLFFTLLLGFSAFLFSENNKKNELITLKNGVISLKILRSGGSYVSMHLLPENFNPFTWKVTREQMPVNNKSGAVFQGHFLCTGRWGAPTDGEMAAGVPHNGQAARDKWKIVKKSDTSVEMYIKAPLDGIEIRRVITLDKNSNSFRVTETFHNYTTIGRLFNVVQHATVGIPFLDDSLRIYTNATKGFMQHLSYPNPYLHAYNWPYAYNSNGGDSIDLSRSDTPDSYVSTHIFNDSIGWIMAISPTHNLSLVYAWKTSDYPWINIWQQRVDGKLWAKGLEFGTTGIGRSYQDLLSHDTSFVNQNSFVFLDAKQTLTKSYCCWLFNKTNKNEIFKILNLQ